MRSEALLRQSLVFRARTAVVGVGVDGDAAARGEEARDLDVLGVHQLDEVLHDDVDDVLVEVAVAAEAEEVELEALALHHPDVGDVADAQLREVRLSRDRTQRRELRAVETHPVVVVAVFVLEGLEHAGIVVLAIRSLAAEGLQTIFGSVHKLLDFADFERVVGDSRIQGIHALGALGVLDEPGGQRQDDDLVEDLGADLGQGELERRVEGHHAPEHDREEDERVGEFAADGREDGAYAEELAAGADLHPAHDPRVDRGADQEGEQRGGRGLGDHREKAVEALRDGLAAVLEGFGQPADELGHQRHEGAENECEPNDEARLAVAVHLGDAVIEDVGHREQQDGAGELQRQPGHLPEARNEEIGCDEADDERDCHHQESGAENV